MSGAPESVRNLETTLVLSLYGSTMMGAQAFEQTLAALSIALEIAAHPKPPSQTAAAFYRRTGKAITRAWHRFQRASASELRKLLPEDFDSELMRDIEIMIDWRDLLAHRYLLKKVVDEPDRRFAADTPAELLQVARQFADLNQRLNAELGETIEILPKGDTPKEVRDLFVSMARPLMFGEAWKPPKSPASDGDA